MAKATAIPTVHHYAGEHGKALTCSCGHAEPFETPDDKLFLALERVLAHIVASNAESFFDLLEASAVQAFEEQVAAGRAHLEAFRAKEREHLGREGGS